MTLTSAVLCGLVAGIVPAWIGSSPRLVRVLGQADARTTRRGTKLRTALAAGQLALSMMLLTGALLMVETLRQLRAIDLGFDATDVSAHHLNLDEHGYTRAQATAYYAGLLQRIHGIPGVTAASVSDRAPFGPSNIRRLRLPEGTDADAVRAVGNGIGNQYLDVLRIPLVRGRGFNADELSLAERSGVTSDTPIILSSSLARRLFGERDPIGLRLAEGADTYRVIGIARDTHWSSVVETDDMLAYLPFGVRESGYLGPVVLVRSSRPLEEVTRAVQAAMSSLDASMPTQFSQSLEASINSDGDLVNRIVFAWALSLLSALGFALAAFGLAGLLAAIVWERTREFGVRMAVGAGRWHLVYLVLRQTGWIAAFGGSTGLMLAWFGSRLLEAQLYGVERFDAGVYVAAVSVLGVVVVIASLWPGYLATRISPIVALRAE